MSQKKPLAECVLFGLEDLFTELSRKGREETAENNDGLQNAIIALLCVLQDGDLGDYRAEVIKRLRAIYRNDELDIRWSAVAAHLSYMLPDDESPEGIGPGSSSTSL